MRIFARSESILNVLLLGSALLSSVAIFSYFILYFNVIPGRVYLTEEPPWEILSSISLGFWALYFFSKTGFHRIISYILVSLYLIAATYTAYNWGADVPQALLIFAMTIVLSGILISSRFSFGIAITTSITLLFLTHVQTKNNQLFSSYWRNELVNMNDMSVIVATLMIIATISWLFNREIEKALNRARKSEENLRKERDMLEVNVTEKTRQLQLVWEKEHINMQEFASIGRHTVGVIHDLVTPLTTLSLNLKMFKNINHSRLISKATQASEQIEQYVEMTRQKLNHKDTQTNFSVSDEITKAKKCLIEKSNATQVKIISPKIPLEILGSPVSFHQLVSNLLDNAIDSYASLPAEASAKVGKKREVLVYIKQNKHHVFLTVTDYGHGIAIRDRKRIFDPFFTTKGSAGKMGIGLAICREIVEKDFGGTIGVKSKLDQGTTFTVRLPVRKSQAV